MSRKSSFDRPLLLLAMIEAKCFDRGAWLMYTLEKIERHDKDQSPRAGVALSAVRDVMKGFLLSVMDQLRPFSPHLARPLPLNWKYNVTSSSGM